MLPVGALGLSMARTMRAAASPSWRASASSRSACHPAVLDASGSATEEPLGAALCVGSVLLAVPAARRGRIVLGLAVINKPWGSWRSRPRFWPLRAPRGAPRGRSRDGDRRAWMVPRIWKARANSRGRAGASTSPVAHPVDLWWPLAHLHTAPT